MRNRWVVVVAFLIAVVGAACAGDTTSVATPEAEDEQPAPFTLTVSNQSFDHPSVGIRVTIDGEVIVEEDFPVEDQHRFVEFAPDVGPGAHTLHAVSGTGAELTFEFTTEDGVSLWAVLDYWFHHEEGQAHFTVQTHEEQPGFG